MIRAGESLKGIPKEFKDDFIDATSLGLKKVDKLKEMISSTFPVSILNFIFLDTSTVSCVHCQTLHYEDKNYVDFDVSTKLIFTLHYHHVVSGLGRKVTLQTLV